MSSDTQNQPIGTVEEEEVCLNAARRKSFLGIITAPSPSAAAQNDLERPLVEKTDTHECNHEENNHVLADDSYEISKRKSSRLSGGSVKEFIKNSLRSGTILSEKAVHDLKRRNPSALDFLTTYKGTAAQVFVFFICVNLFALSPILVRWAKRSPETEENADTFIDGVLLASSNFIVLVAMCLVALCVDGWAGLKACLNPRSVLTMSPPSLVFAVADCLSLIALNYVDAATCAIVMQFKIVISAILCRVFLNRHLLAVQWACLCVLTTNLAVYLRLDNIFLERSTAPEQQAQTTAAFILGITILFSRVALSAPAGVMADALFKHTQQPFYVQLAQSMVSSVIGSMCVAAVQVWKEDLWGQGVFSGKDCGALPDGTRNICVNAWNGRVLLLMLWFAMKTTVACLLIKRLDVVWKGIADSLAVLLTYVYGIVFLAEMKGGWGAFELKFALILSLFFTVFGFVVSKSGPPLHHFSPHMPHIPHTVKRSFLHEAVEQVEDLKAQKDAQAPLS